MKKSSIINELRAERKELDQIIRAADNRLHKAPEGNVRIIRHRQGHQFYLRMSGNDKSGKYIPVAEHDKARALMQKRYDQQIKAAAEKQRAALDRFLKGYDPEILKTIYTSMSDVRRESIIPAQISDQEFIRQWEQAEYVRKGFKEGTVEHYTSKNEQVRSKSEVMIADALRRAGIPYHYERPLKLGNDTLHPDFTILRVEDRCELLWEHLGRMDDKGYCQKALRRIREYEKYGIYPGIHLIITMETSDCPINLSIINHIIKLYCM